MNRIRVQSRTAHARMLDGAEVQAGERWEEGKEVEGWEDEDDEEEDEEDEDDEEEGGVDFAAALSALDAATSTASAIGVGGEGEPERELEP